MHKGHKRDNTIIPVLTYQTVDLTGILQPDEPLDQ